MGKGIGRIEKHVERLIEYNLWAACLSMAASRKCVGRGIIIAATSSITLKTSYEIRLDSVSPMIL